MHYPREPRKEPQASAAFAERFNFIGEVDMQAIFGNCSVYDMRPNRSATNLHFYTNNSCVIITPMVNKALQVALQI